MEGGAIFNYGGISTVHFNSIVGNYASLGSAISNVVGGTVDAELNWWGDNNSPAGKITGLTVTKWLVLRINAVPLAIPNEGISVITADLTHDNMGTPQTGGYLPNGIPVKFTTTLGNLDSIGFTSNGLAYTTLHAGNVAGNANISAKLDNQTLNILLKIKDTIPPKIASIAINAQPETPIKPNIPEVNAVSIPMKKQELQ